MEELKEIVKLLIEFLLRYGVIGVLAIAVILLVQDPERAVKLKAILFEPIFRFTKWGSKQYIGSVVSSQVTDFLKTHVAGKLSNKGPLRIKVKWVTSPSDPVLKTDGTVILRMRETHDQTRNVLTATQLVLPYTVFALLRPTLDKSVRTAIDLVILNKMALKLGTHARAVFQRNFLAPETEADQRVADLFAELVELDFGGLFVSIFLEELETLADTVYVVGDFVDKSNEVCALLAYLLTIVRRDVGEEVDLVYHSAIFHIGIIMVAKSLIADVRGIGPYLRRLQKNLNGGCDTIYLLAFSHKESFLSRVIRAIEQEDRVIVDKNIGITLKEKGEAMDRARVVRLHRNSVFSDEIFRERLNLTGIKVGEVVEGLVTDVSPEQAIVIVRGLNGRISRRDCCWATISSCSDVLAVNEKLDFRVTEIRKDLGELKLTLRFPSEDPWRTTSVPNRGDVVEVSIVRDVGLNYLCRLDTGLELALPKAEVSWLGSPESQNLSLVGTRQRVMIYEVDPDTRAIRSSMKRLEEDPWSQIEQRFPKGRTFRGRVIKTTPEFVHVELEDGVTGGVPRASMVAAGFEYAAFENNVVPGQGLDVVVSDVLVNKRIIRLELQRNITARKAKAKTSAANR